MRPHRRQPTRLPRPWDSPGKNTGMDCHFLLQCVKMKSESEVAQSCPTLSHPMDYSLPGSSIHGIFQARVLEWGAIAFSNLRLWVPPIQQISGTVNDSCLQERSWGEYCRKKYKHNRLSKNQLKLINFPHNHEGEKKKQNKKTCHRTRC